MKPRHLIAFARSRRGLLIDSAAVAASAALLPRHEQQTMALNATPVAASVPSAAVSTAAGPVTGLGQSGVVAYKGIPYAVPPLGALRWLPPQPATPWTEPLAAEAFCSDCMQVIGPETIETTPSEDCLCLNIWAPESAKVDAALPVLIWIHGGGYVGGGSSIPWLDGAPFARQGMIVVTFNYRLGRFGYFIPSMVKQNTDPPYGNYGYQDQIAVLRWVQANVAAFGGDPAKITLMGESAGGASVIHLITSPAVEAGLFQQAVILSGGGREALIDRPLETKGIGNLSAVDVDSLFAASAGVVGSAPEKLEKLQALPAEDLVADLDMEKLTQRKLLGATLPGVPVVDGEIVSGQPQDHFLDGTCTSMPIIIGTTALDVPTHFPPDKLHPLSWFGPDEDAAKDAYGFGDDPFLGPAGLVRLSLDIGSDLTMHEPAHFIASTMHDAGHPAWVYRFTYTAQSTRPNATAQVHAGELPFLFDNLAARYGNAVTAEDEATATAFHTYVSNFVIGGNPNGTGLPEWPAIVPDEFDVMDFTLDDGPVFGPDPRSSVSLVAAARARHQGENL